jgi:membrane fusion protein (multidrug efflux system)
VSSGVAAGDQVIVSGVQKAQPGQPAKAVPWKPDTQPAVQPSAKQDDTSAADEG